MSSVFIALILIGCIAAAVAFFVFISSRASKKRKAGFIRSFNKTSEKFGLDFSIQLFLPKHAIGLDKTNRMFLHVEEKETGLEDTLIDLRQVKSCKARKIHEYSQLEKGKERPEETLNNIVLELQFHDLQKPVSITFYDHFINNIHDIADMETKAKEWENLVSPNLITEQKDLTKAGII